MTRKSPTDLDQLASLVRGRVWLPDDPAYERTRRPWNLAIDQQPLAVVEAADTEDVAQLVRFAHSRDIPIATQPSGHGATGRVSGTILLRTRRLDTIDIDPVAGTARIGSGVRSGDLQRAVSGHGLTALPGSSPVVSVTGAALGGGLSWFSRAYGWMADSILSADVVMADGTRRCLSDADSDLLWALRGGGGELAIVVNLELRLHPAPTLFGGRQLWPFTEARRVAEIYRSMTATAPDTLTLWLELLHFPGSDPMIAIDSTFLGDEKTARHLMRASDTLPAPLSDSRAAMSVADLGAITAEPTDPGPGKSRGELLTRLDDPTLATLIETPITPLMTIQIRHLGGALGRPSDSPHGPLVEPYAVYMFGAPTTLEADEQIGRKQDALVRALPLSGRKPITFLGPAEQLSNALPTRALRKLQALKNQHDPKGIIHGNFALPRETARERVPSPEVPREFTRHQAMP